MIHQLLNLTRPLFIFDTETTGVDPQTDRIVELGFQQWGPEGLVKEYRTLINPRVPIPPGASKVHGIYDDDFKKCTTCGSYEEPHVGAVISYGDGLLCDRFHRPYTFAELAPSLAKGFVNCDFGGKNVRFDIRILLAEMARNGVQWSIEGARIVDAERLEQLAVPRDLGSLHEKYTGAKHEGAHGALSDVQASTTVIVKQLEAHATLPRDLDALHAKQWPGMIDIDGKFRFVDGVPCFSGWGKYANRPMTVADNGYWDYILKNSFGAEVQALARAAKLGKYPTAK